MIGSGVKRGAAAAGTFVLAAAAAAVTGMLTQHRAIAWWVAAGVIVIIGAALQWWLTASDNEDSLSGQQVDRAVVGGALRQRVRGMGRQAVIRSRVTGDLVQDQGDGDATA